MSLDNLRVGLAFDDVLLVPRRSGIRSRQDVSLRTQLSRRVTLGLPVVAANMDTVCEAPMAIAVARVGGIGMVHRFLPIDSQAEMVAQVKGQGLQVGAAVGTSEDSIERAKALVNAGADALVLDIAHGHAEHAIAAVGAVREAVPGVDIIAGNVATGDGARDLAEAGADAVKVGVGPGSVCTTRLVAGVGVPQLTAVIECARACAEYDVPVIADGGIRYPGDVAKAIAGGAESVMLGGMLAGTPESPGVAVTRDGRKVKVFRGMASAPAAEARAHAEDDEFVPTVPEGVETVVPLRDPASEIVRNLVGGLRSGMSYSDAATIAQMHANATFVRITTAGLHESHPHALGR